jgi:UDP-3-O-[3-hydroxymyristoyl] glucosamine N-acyltransferase
MLTLGQIAEIIGAELVPADQKDTPAHAIAPIEKAAAGDVTFLTSKKFDSLLDTCQATAIICTPDYKDRQRKATALLLHNAPYVGFARLMQHWYKKEETWIGVSDKAAVAADVQLGTEVSIHPFVSIAKGSKIGEKVIIHSGVSIGENVEIGDGTLIRPNVTIYADSKIGRGVILQAGVVIGSDGFGFAPDLTTGEHVKIPHVGNVVIEDSVEVGANSTIDRGVMGSTKICAGAKIDNLVQIAHNVEVGRGCFVAAQVGIAGSATLGNYVVLGGQVGVIGHIKIGDFVQIGAQSGIGKDAAPGSKWWGSPAVSGQNAKKCALAFQKGPKLRLRVKALERTIAGIEEQLSDKTKS